jgi:hypothetical protein
LVEVRISVPIPSAASTELEANVTFATPEAFALNTMVNKFPEIPIKPGGKRTLSKFTMPAVFENVGFNASIESSLTIDETESKSFGKEIIAEAAFMAESSLDTKTLTVMVEPTMYIPKSGEIDKVAAFNVPGLNKKNSKKTILIKLLLKKLNIYFFSHLNNFMLIFNFFR